MQDFQEEDFVIVCPQCNDPVWIVKINCQIFRHAAYIMNGEQIPPHTPEEECLRLIAGNAIFGCGKPFRIAYNKEKQLVAVKCEYI